MIILVHVDDCTVVGTSIYLINEFKTKISKHVEITDLGEIHWILGIKSVIIANSTPSTSPNVPISSLPYNNMVLKI